MRVARAEILKAKDLTTARAARRRGSHDLAHPRSTSASNALPPLLVSAAFGVAWAILAPSRAFLSGGGASRASTPGRNSLRRPTYIDEAWWMALFPGFALFLTVCAYNLLAEGLRTATTGRT